MVLISFRFFSLRGPRCCQLVPYFVCCVGSTGAVGKTGRSEVHAAPCTGRLRTMRNRLVLDSLPSLRPQSLCPQAKGEVGDTERILMLVFRDTGALVETNWSDAANQADEPPKREGANHVIAIGSPDTEGPYYLSLLLSKIIMTISRNDGAATVLTDVGCFTALFYIPPSPANRLFLVTSRYSRAQESWKHTKPY